VVERIGVGLLAAAVNARLKKRVDRPLTREMKGFLVFGLIAGGAWFYFSQPAAPVVQAAPPPVALQPVSETDVPMQRNVSGPPAFEVNGYEVRALQAFAIKARVLSIEHYRTGREADLSPTDIAFGWGKMADPTIADKVSISQGGRWYHWRYSGKPPLPVREIETSSANMHLIPASREVARALSAVDKGQLVSLRGYLVEVRARDGWMWRSSLTREDTGNGSCELVFVQALDFH
jgi:hypothetical protein